jgi:hypothetical protein
MSEGDESNAEERKAQGSSVHPGVDRYVDSASS